MRKFITKASGKKQKFVGGGQRDVSEGKPRYDLIPVPALKRVAELYARGAVHYGDRNWEKGMPTSRFLESLERHLFQYAMGEKDEDHLAAVIWGCFALMHFEGTSWDDLHKKNGHKNKKDKRRSPVPQKKRTS